LSEHDLEAWFRRLSAIDPPSLQTDDRSEAEVVRSARSFEGLLPLGTMEEQHRKKEANRNRKQRADARTTKGGMVNGGAKRKEARLEGYNRRSKKQPS
jgi:hypothetical protein